jgi:hypothetical protein
MKVDGRELFVAICVMFGFTIMIGMIYGYFYTDMQKQSLYQKTYDKSMECRIAYKDRDTRYIDNVCGAIPKLEDFVK